MKNKKKVAAKVALAITLTSISVYLFAPWEFALHFLAPLPTTLEEELDAAVDRGIDGIILYVDQKGSPPEAYARGWHDRKRKIPTYPEALFKIASINKLYVASAITKLSTKGALSLDGTIAEYLPDLATRIENAGQITVKMLVQHQSGIPNFTDHPEFNWGREDVDPLNLILDEKADFEPGEDTAYSNSNYLLLEMIMDARLGYPHTRFIKEQILEPLGCDQTYFSVNEVEPDKLMSGYYVGNDTDFKYLDQGYVASARDVGIFLRALNQGDFFSLEERAIYDTLYHHDHTGWVLGYSSIARFNKETDTVIIQFVNTTGNDTVLLTGIVFDRVAEILKNRSK